MRILTVVWLILLLALSLSPVEFKAHLHTRGRLHDIFHILAFLITALLLATRSRSAAQWIGAALVAAAAAFTSEWLEHHFYRNRIEWGDVKLDLLGVAAGLLLANLSRLWPGRDGRTLT